MRVELVFKVRVNSGTTYSSHVFQNLDIIPAEVALRDGVWVFDKSSKVTYYPNSIRNGCRGHYEVQYLIHADDQDVPEIHAEIDEIPNTW